MLHETRLGVLPSLVSWSAVLTDGLSFNPPALMCTPKVGRLIIDFYMC